MDQKGDAYEATKKFLYSRGATYEYNGATYTYDPVDICAALLKSNVYTKKYLSGIASDGNFWTLNKPGTPAQVLRLYVDAYSIVGEIIIEDKNTEDKGGVMGYPYYKYQLAIWDKMPLSERNDENYDADTYALYTTYCNIFEQYVLKQKSETSVLYNLGTYFKETAFETSATGWKASKAVIQNAIMYVLLVSYSLVFFISYTKRLFYVIMLILMAPIVVVFDFFMKFGK